jgi:hypothetical protein
MTMSEYEERFRPPAPSLHQTFAATRQPHRERRRSQYPWIAVAVVGVLAMTCTVTSHYVVQSEITGAGQHAMAHQ